MLRWVWREPDAVRVFEIVLAVGAVAAAGGIFHHAADGVVEHADPGNGPRRAAGENHGSLFDDVHGNGPGWSAVGWRVVGSPGRAADGRDRRAGFGLRGVVVRRAVAEDSRGSAAVNYRAG